MVGRLGALRTVENDGTERPLLIRLLAFKASFLEDALKAYETVD